MNRSIKREITILVETYFWVIDGNRVDGSKEEHIRIHPQKLSKSLLYLDQYNWHFESNYLELKYGKHDFQNFSTGKFLITYLTGTI